jgi:hypothetical protein
MNNRTFLMVEVLSAAVGKALCKSAINTPGVVVELCVFIPVEQRTIVIEEVTGCFVERATK